MPSIVSKFKIKDPFLSRSTKLLPCQKERIKIMSSEGISAHQLSKIFKVSRRLIQFIIDPVKHQNNKQKRKDRGGSKKYYSERKNALSLKRHKKYKQELFKHIIMKNKVQQDAKKILARFKNNKITSIQFIDELIALNWHLIKDMNYWLEVKNEIENAKI